MAVSSRQAASRLRASGLNTRGGAPWRPEATATLAIALVAFLLALITHAVHLEGLLGAMWATIATLLLFAICGDALRLLLVPRSWGALGRLLSVPIGAAASGLVLTALGFAHLPLRVSLWLVLAAGIAASVAIRRERRRRRLLEPPVDRAQLWSWLCVLFVLLCVALMPVWRNGADTVFGENPDAHQVTGIAVLFQHVPPTTTDVALPIDKVPRAWRFRYSIFYPLAAASNISHLDPIRVFPAMAAVLVVVAALGYGAVAVRCLRAPPPAGLAVAAVITLWSVALQLAWHPYWNQLWGFALLPYALLFGWRALADGDGRAAALLALILLAIGLGYPLALPYPLVMLAALAVAYWRRPRVPRLVRSHGWIAAALALLILLPAVVGAASKLGSGLHQVFSPHSALWGGDIKQPLGLGKFVGTGGGFLPALGVAALALLGLRALPRRPAVAVGLALTFLCLIDLRFRLASAGGYMDFKHLSFVCGMVLTLAATAVLGLVRSRSRAVMAAGLAIGLCWTFAALAQDRRQGFGTGRQVSNATFQIRDWARRLPRGASVRVDVPPSGTQLWAVYMLGDHPVDSPEPVIAATYAHARYGVRASYSLSLRYYPNSDARIKRPYPLPPSAQDPPLFENDTYVLRRIAWPARYSGVRDTSSTALVEP